MCTHARVPGTPFLREEVPRNVVISFKCPRECAKGKRGRRRPPLHPGPVSGRPWPRPRVPSPGEEAACVYTQIDLEPRRTKRILRLRGFPGGPGTPHVGWASCVVSVFSDKDLFHKFQIKYGKYCSITEHHGL